MHPMRVPADRVRRAALLGAIVAALLLSADVEIGHLQSPLVPGAHFADRVAQLSEPGGFFDTDNLISNEKSYLHVVPALRRAGLAGGAYIGVGPDQNFSYIAQVKPDIAFIVDLRRDNLLLHLLFKAIFALSTGRAEYLSQMFGRAPPMDSGDWKDADLEKIVAYVERTPPAAQAALTALEGRVDAQIRKSGVPLSDADMATIHRFHRRFVTAGLDLKFQSTGRAPQGYYPTYRDLLLETDQQGHRWNFLASEGAFETVRSLEQRDLIIPVVGDLAGWSALAKIGQFMASRGDRLSAFYASNVEFYLFGDGKFDRYVQNLSHIPHTNRSLIIRSVFGGFGQRVPGYYSNSLVQPVDELLHGYEAGQFRSYAELTVTH
jgi:hypothetical protein